MAYSVDISAQNIGPVAPSLPAPLAGSAPTAVAQQTSEQGLSDTVADVITDGTHNGVSTVYNPVTRALSITNTDKGSVAVTAHEAALDPHPQYETSAEAAAKISAHVADADPHTQYVKTDEAGVRLGSAFQVIDSPGVPNNGVTITAGARSSLSLGSTTTGSIGAFEFDRTQAAIVLMEGLATAPTESLRLKGAQLFMGATTGMSMGNLRLNIVGTTFNNSSASFSRFQSASADGPYIYLGKSRGAAAGDYSPVITNDILGRIHFVGSDGASFGLGGEIYAAASEDWSGTNRGTVLSFWNTLTGSTTRYAHMQLVGSGQTQVYKAAMPIPSYSFVGDNNTGVGSAAADTLSFVVNGTERMRMLPGGGLLLGAGVTTGVTGIGTGALNVIGTTYSSSLAIVGVHSNDTAPAYLTLFKSRSTAVGTYSAVVSGDPIGRIQFAGDDGTAGVVGAMIQAVADAAPSAGSVPTRIQFNVGTSGGGTERFRITNQGAWGLGGANYGTAGQVLQSNGAALPPTWVTLAGGGGPVDHGALTGLADDDHTQYHTDARGDLRYSLLAHTHTAAQITDFSEAVDDRVSSLLVAGSNITLTYNDVANTLTVASTGGGGGGAALDDSLALMVLL